MADIDIDRPAASTHFLECTPYHHVTRCLVAHRVIILHKRITETVDEFSPHAEESIEPGRAEALGEDGQANVFNVCELDAGVEGGAMQIASVGRAIPKVERIAGLSLEHAVGIAGRYHRRL